MVCLQRAHGYVDPSVEHDWTAGHLKSTHDPRHSNPMRTPEPGVASTKTHDSVTNDPDPTWTLDTVRPPSLWPSGHPQYSSESVSRSWSAQPATMFPSAAVSPELVLDSQQNPHRLPRQRYQKELCEQGQTARASPVCTIDWTLITTLTAWNSETQVWMTWTTWT